ncbi:uncharacterized protein [Triticum aestivum]|uniref:uncharacterized protein n=1 Tax=Triticum aestivum TaxID=4565 RepID=UPI001D00A9B1|nr:uncharacterized protein LOC123042733 [Triticum aestivum]
MGIHAAARTTKQWLRELFTPPCAHGGSACRRREPEPVFDKLPVDIIHHIHSLLPVRDAARAACVCRGFLRSWRCYANLTLSVEALGLTGKKYKDDADIFLRDAKKFIDIVDKILRNHSRHGVEISRLDLELYPCKNINASYLDRWLQITAVRPGIKELKLVLCGSMKKEYIFPCSVLSNEAAASSIRSLELHACTFRPTTTLGCLSRLETLCLYRVNITDEGLGHLLSKSFGLGQIDIINCSKIICLKIPCTLQQLNVLTFSWCERLQAVEINAPNLSTLHFIGTLVEISVAHPSQLQDVHLVGPSHLLSYARAKLPCIAPNVKSLSLISVWENVNTPMMPSKFSHLKKLKIDILRSFIIFDVLSLVSFLDASPALDSFTLHVGQDTLRPDDFVVGGDNSNYKRWQPQRRHDSLREVTITGFCSSKKLVQFVIYILEGSPRLDCLTLDTTPGPRYTTKCGIIRKHTSSKKMGIYCPMMTESNIAEAQRAVKVVNTYIAGRVPSGVGFQVLQPCSECNNPKRW